MTTCQVQFATSFAFLCLLSACEADRGSGGPPLRRPDAAGMEDAGAADAAEVDATADAGEDATVQATCTSDTDCDDGVFCDGTERCVQGQCVDALRVPCKLDSMCSEQAHDCSCDYDQDGVRSARCAGTDCDEDHDNHEALECPEGDDCDDTDDRRYYGNAEVCDAEGVDEDCDMTTFAGAPRDDDPENYDRMRDQDGDGVMNAQCRNLDPVTGELHYALALNSDCNDLRGTVNPKAQEICDDLDNDCDGFTDEVPGSRESLSQQQVYCYDADGDGYGRWDNTGRFCTRPLSYAPCRFDEPHGEDCNDGDAQVHPGNKVFEVCDGEDNDCDGKIDQEDHDVDPLPDQLSSLNAATQLVCRDKRWWITDCPDGFRWCDQSTVVHGCETDIRRLTSCRSCQPTDCHLSCGEQGCDEAVRLSVGYQHACAITQEGRAVCWGRGSEGRLGNDNILGSPVPVEVVGLRGVREIAAGYEHSCAIVGEDGSVYCWGDNTYNQLASPDGSTSNNPSPVPVVGFDSPRLRAAVHLAVGAQHSCALLGTGEVFCWGESGSGRLGDTSDETGPADLRQVQRADVTSPVGFAWVNDATSIAAGTDHTCVLSKTGGVSCWGDNSTGQLGDPTFAQPYSIVARPVPGIAGATQIAAGNRHTCALVQGSVRCWGLNRAGQLGRPSEGRDNEPAPVLGIPEAGSIAAGFNLSCALTVEGKTWCWGYLYPLGAAEAETMPGPIDLAGVGSIGVGSGFVCGIAGERARCLGNNYFGELGSGAPSAKPLAISQFVSPIHASN